MQWQELGLLLTIVESSAVVVCPHSLTCALFRLLGSMLSELIINWTIYENKVNSKIYAVLQ